MKILKIEDKDYPQKLKVIYNAPKKLYVLGDEKILNKFGIGIVGTRKASQYGKKMARSLSFNLTKHDVNIISGMAIRN